MAEIAINLVLPAIAERLSTFLINESAALSEVVSQVEWIERELRLMQAFLEHVERRGQGDGEGVNEWAEELKDVALDAEDVIETFVIKSVKRRRSGVLSWVDRYKVGKELDRISKKMRDMSQGRMNYGQEQTNIGVVVETPPEISVSSTTPDAIVAPAVDKLSYILSQNLITRGKVRKIVEQVRDEVMGMHNVVSNLESTSEREKVWLEEVKGVCNLIVDVAGNFITRRESYSHASERKLRKEMKYIRTQIGDAIHRRLTYGIGEDDVGGMDGDRKGSRSLKRLIIPKVALFICFILTFVFIHDALWYYLGTVIIIILSVMTVDSILYDVIVWAVASWRFLDKNLESIRRDLELMRALFSDIEIAEGLNERQKVWVDQLRVVAQHAESALVAAPLYQKKEESRRLKFAMKINGLLYEIRNVSERKTIYGIANIEGRKGLVSLGQSSQESGTEINTSVVEHNDNSGVEEPAPATSLQDMNHVHEYRPFTGLKEKVQSIRGEMQLMDALFKDVQEMGELDERSKVWVDQMRGIARETESVIDYASKLEHIHILNYWTRYVIKKKITNIRNKVLDASRRRKVYGSLQFQSRVESFSMVQRLHRRTHPSLIVKESSIVGFDDDVEVLMAQLFSDEERRCITSVIGIGGTGKTTLARLIFDNNAVIDHFHYRVWVSMTQNYTVELLLEDIARQIMGVQEVKWEDLTKVLQAFLANKRYLIVVDNVQTPQVWDSLKKIIPDMSTGCRILLTSRYPSVVLNGGPRTFAHQMQLLNDQESWVLFRRNLKLDIPRELMKVGEDIVRKCGGLPSEILKMAELLSQKDVTFEKWPRVIVQLNEDKKPWFETLDTINMNLPPYLRRCLFYFVLFPAEFDIPARRLVVLWVAEGLVHRGGNEESPELVAERYLTELVDLNMVQIAKRKHNGKVKTCRLPNALRELWLTKAKESRFLLQHHTGTNSNSTPKTSLIRRVADHLDKNDICYDHIHGDNKSNSTSLRTYYKDVLSFLSFDAQEGSKPGADVGNFLNSCISSNCFLLLRVLDLEHVYKPQLPKNIGRLSQLRYLGLRWTYLDSLPSSISNLLKLQTLDLKHTGINTLTSSIWKMQLRHLYLSETYRSRFPLQPKGNSLSDLQTLWGLFVDEETPVKGGLDRLVNIRKLGLACQSMSLQQGAMTSQLDAVADWILKLGYLQSMRLKSRDEEGRPWNLHLKSLKNHTCLTDMYLLGSLSSPSILSQFPPSLVALTLSHSRLLEDPMQILNDLPNLRSLSLLSESYMGKTLLCNSGSFPQLHVLKFWKLEQLEEWNIEQEALPCLRQLEIRSCGCLKMLPDGLQHVKTLLELKLTNMPMEFKSRISDTDSEDWHKISHIPNVF